MNAVAAALPAVPLLAAILGWPLRRHAAIPAIAGAAVAFVLAIVLATGADGEFGAVLASSGNLDIRIGALIDGPAKLLAIAVCVVALLVQIYSVEYMAADERYPTYAAEVSLFTAAMLAVVVSADLLTLLVGWEVMGLCSYLLIGHYRELPEVPGAALKAFLITRIGDVGLLIGILLLGVHAGTFRITAIIARVPQLPHGVLLASTLLILAGAIGKSAQFPLHTWLPDAMAGPTPISALIHAATMVAAGVYLLVRLFPIFAAAPATLAVIGVIAAISMLLAALSALAQDDIKRVLAWSTISQLAYMTGAVAVGGTGAAMFHLITHAAFKALLFLAAGAVLEAAGTGLMSGLGGLRKSMPVTCAVSVAGGAALAGLLPFSGGFSKESVLDAAWQATHGHGPAASWVGWLVVIAGLSTVFVTAAYVTRLLLRTFWGSGTAHVREAGLWMRVPLLILLVPTVLLGFAAIPDGGFASWLGVPVHELRPQLGLSVLSTGLLLAGGFLVFVLWRRDPAVDPVLRLGRLAQPLRRGFYLDAVQERLVVRPTLAAAALISTVDSVGVDGAVEGTGRGATSLGRFVARAQAIGLQGYLTGVLAGGIFIAIAVAVVW